MESPPTRHTITRILSIWGVPTLLVAIFLASNLTIFLTHQNKTADYGLEGLQIISASKFSALLGAPSRWQHHHPGPIYFYYLAFAEKLIPFCLGQGAHMLALLMLNGLLLVWISYLLLKYTNRELIAPICCFMIIAVLKEMRCDVFINVWSPTAFLFPFALLCVGGAGFAIGKTGALPALIVGGAFVAQSQLSAAFSAAAVVCTSSVLFVWTRRKTGWRFTRLEKITIILSLAFMVSAWAPPVIEELSPAGGNLTRLSRFILYAAKNGPRWPRAFQQLYESMILPFHRFAGAADGVTARGICIILAAIVSVVLGFRSRRIFIRALTGICLLATAASIYSWANIVGDMCDHIFFYYQIIAALIYSIGIASILLPLPECRAAGRCRQAATPLVLISTLIGSAVLIEKSQDCVRNIVNGFPFIDDLYAAIGPDRETVYELIWSPAGKHHGQWETAAALAYKLKMGGYAVCAHRDCFGFGRDMVPPSAGKVKPVLLFNPDVPQKEIDAVPFKIQKDVVGGPTRLLICETPSVGLPLVIRHDSSDVYFSGFGSPTKELRWTGWGSADIEFFLEEPPPGNRSYMLALSIMSFEPQVIKLTLNDNVLGQPALAEQPYKLVCNVSDKVLNLHGRNTLSIDLLNARRLNGWGKETRGIGFVDLVLDYAPLSTTGVKR